jgi:nucleoside-diphosphate-sugar epimerase
VDVCITGGSGFIGWYLARALAARGRRLVNLDLIDPPADLPPHRFVKGDVRDPEALRAALRGCDTVFHLAAAHHDFGIEEATYYAVNAQAARTMCQVCDELAVRRICFYSTVAVYGDVAPPLHEETPPHPVSFYGKSKLEGENVFRAWTATGGGRACLVIRPTVTFGPRNFANMYSLIRQIESGRFAFVGRADNIKSLSYVENIVDATMFLLDRPERPAFDAYNYVEKPDFTSRRIVQTIYQAMGRRPPRWHIPLWLALLAALPFDLLIALTGRNIPISRARVRKLFADQTKFEADKVLQAGFTPRVDLAEGIRRMVEWYQRDGRNVRVEWHQPPAEVVPMAAG